jgi:hypothetical protein
MNAHELAAMHSEADKARAFEWLRSFALADDAPAEAGVAFDTWAALSLRARQTPASVEGQPTDTQRLDYLDSASNEMLLEFGFEIDGGVYLRIDAPGHGGTDIREKNSARAAIDSAMVVAPC